MQGIKVTKLHTKQQFEQSPWLTKYINQNKDQIARAETKFEKTF